MYTKFYKVVKDSFTNKFNLDKEMGKGVGGGGGGVLEKCQPKWK